MQTSRLAASHELIWGHTFCSWRVGTKDAQGTEDILYPLLLTRVRIEVDNDDGTIRVIADGVPELQLNPLEGLGLPTMDDLVALGRRIDLDPPDPWSRDSLAGLQRQLIVPLGLDATAVSAATPPSPGATPVITDGWVLALRPRPARHDRFYRELAELLSRGGTLPQSLAAAVADADAVRASLVQLGVSEVGEWTAVGERMLVTHPARRCWM